MSLPVSERRFLPLALTVALAIGLSLVAYAGYVPPTIAAHGIDKVLHLTMGFLLAFALGLALRGRIVLAGALVFVPLALDEYFQRFSAARSSDWGDLLADALGVVLAIAGAAALRSRRRSHAPT